MLANEEGGPSEEIQSKFAVLGELRKFFVGILTANREKRKRVLNIELQRAKKVIHHAKKSALSAKKNEGGLFSCRSYFFTREENFNED